MFYNNNHYDKISERKIGKKSFVFYRLRFDDIKDVTGNIYLVEMEGLKGKKKYKELNKIRNVIKGPDLKVI